MRKYYWIACALLLTTVLIGDAQIFRRGGSCGPSGCSGGSCGPGGCAINQEPEPSEVWRQSVDPKEIALFRNGVHIGNYRAEDNTWTPREGNGWGTRVPWFSSDRSGILQQPEKDKPTGHIVPVEKPADVKIDDGVKPNGDFGGEKKYFFGVDQSKVPKEESYEFRGKKCDRHQVFVELAEDRLTDDRDKLHLTFMTNDPAKLKRFHNDWKTSPLLQQFHSKVQLQEYDVTKPVAKIMLRENKLEMDERFQKSGVMFAFQGPVDKDGKSKLAPVYSYDGPESLAATLSSIYDPNKNKELTPAGPMNSSMLIIAVVLVGLLLFLVMKPNE